MLAGEHQQLLILVDPRTQAYWGSRFGDLLATLRALVGR